MITTLLSALAALQAPVATTPPPAPPATAPVTPAPAAQFATLFILTYEQGPNWIVGQPMHRQRLGGHFRYMQKLAADGALVGGGPFVGEVAGMAIVRATDLAAARAILSADPAVTDGIFIGRARAWEVRVGAMRLPEN